MAIPWSTTLPAFFSTSVNPCIIVLKHVEQCKANILSICWNPSNSYLLSLDCESQVVIHPKLQFSLKVSLAYVKVKLSLCLIKHHVMKIYEGVEVYFHHSWPWH
jgi:hypothetical protein